MRATRHTFRTTPLPARHEALDYRASFTAEQAARLRHGLVPEDMDDKWFVFFEKGWLYCHRSWTGFCIYALELKDTNGGLKVVQARVNRDPAQYRSTDSAADTCVLEMLVRRLADGPAASVSAGYSRPD